MVIDPTFWSGRRVFVTGHTGFKGAWLTLWLQEMGATVSGYSLAPTTPHHLYGLATISGALAGETIGDIRDQTTLMRSLQQSDPEIIFHLAAQAIVLEGYDDPVGTFSTNVIGTVGLLHAARTLPDLRAVVVVTSDKCYENREWVWGYREDDVLGGHDPYSASKGAAELAVASMRQSFFPVQAYSDHGIAVATARAGNVIGGGDWAPYRLVPDLIRAMLREEVCRIRRAEAVRPWQHVLDPLHGYLALAQSLITDGPHYAEAWNFGPRDDSAKTVGWIADYLCLRWGHTAGWQASDPPMQHENSLLRLDISKAAAKLGWSPLWDIEDALDAVIDWYKVFQQGTSMREFSLAQIAAYCRVDAPSFDRPTEAL